VTRKVVDPRLVARMSMSSSAYVARFRTTVGRYRAGSLMSPCPPAGIKFDGRPGKDPRGARVEVAKATATQAEKVNAGEKRELDLIRHTRLPEKNPRADNTLDATSHQHFAMPELSHPSEFMLAGLAVDCSDKESNNVADSHSQHSARVFTMPELPDPSEFMLAGQAGDCSDNESNNVAHSHSQHFAERNNAMLELPHPREFMLDSDNSDDEDSDSSDEESISVSTRRCHGG